VILRKQGKETEVVYFILLIQPHLRHEDEVEGWGERRWGIHFALSFIK
jgi:hypothetical protein